MNVHLTLQGKGGVGKSFASIILAQYLRQSGDILCIDTDPVNKTFSSISSLKANESNIIQDKVINEKRFDDLIELILKTEKDTIIDNGSSSFISLTAYLIQYNILEFLKENGVNVFVHVVVTGGPAMLDTMSGLDFVIENFGDDAKIIVWRNEFFGKISVEEKDFEETDFYLEAKDKIFGIITIPDDTKNLFGENIKEMLEEKLTFDEYLNSEEKFILNKQRIKMVREKYYNSIAAVL